MAIALLNRTATGTTDLNNITSASIDTTGASLLVVVVSATASITPTDSQGNTWTLAVEGTVSGRYVDIWYCANPTTNAAHTFSAASSFKTPAIAAYAFSGTLTSGVLDLTSHHDSGSSQTSWAAGSAPVTPSQDGSLLFAALNTAPVSSTPAIDSGYSALGYYSPSVTSQNMGTGYLVQTTASGSNPTFSWSGSVDACGAVAVFKAAVAAFNFKLLQTLEG